MTRKKTKENSKNASAQYWIKKLRLEPHPEGGYFRQTYKSELTIVPEAPSQSVAPGPGATSVRQPENPDESQNPHPVAKSAVGHPAFRAASTGIYFLLEGENFSAFHRLRSDEMWHFYAGSPLVVHQIDAAGEYSSILLGNNPDADQVFQAVVKAGCWFASELAPDSNSATGSVETPTLRQAQGRLSGKTREKSWALVGCTVAPGFEFEDFELAKRKELVRRFRRHRGLIERLTTQ